MKISAQRDRISRQRLLAGLGVLVFVAVFFALPLYAAATLCAMPCCASDSSTTPVMSIGMPECATDCFVHSEEATAAFSLQFAAPENRVVHLVSSTPLMLASSASFAPCVADDVGLARSGTAAPVHLLNSVFRI